MAGWPVELRIELGRSRKREDGNLGFRVMKYAFGSGVRYIYIRYSISIFDSILGMEGIRMAKGKGEREGGGITRWV
jgi:hypothetical protein